MLIPLITSGTDLVFETLVWQDPPQRDPAHSQPAVNDLASVSTKPQLRIHENKISGIQPT